MTGVPSDTGTDSPESFLAIYRCVRCGATVSEHGRGQKCRNWRGLSPRFAWALSASLEILGDQWAEIPDMIEVPHIAQARLSDRPFCGRMKASAHHLADEIATGHADSKLPRCAADEVNLAMALQRALEVVVEGAWLPLPDELVGSSVEGAEADFAYAYDALRQDSDVEMLWNMQLDGIENDEAVLRRLGASHLHPRDWFEPFLHVTTKID